VTAPIDLSVHVDAVPNAGLLRPAIEAALAGRAWPPGPEAAIANAGADAVAAGGHGAAGGGAPC
jgi:hypothetical protein